MRREYEAAIGRLITNHTAMALFVQNPGIFLRDYDLDEDERASILGMEVQLQGMCLSFTGKRKRILEKPLAHTIALFGKYGDMLLRRYINLYPPAGDYVAEHDTLVKFLEVALMSSDGLGNITLLNDVLQLESALFKALHAVIPGEEIEHINDPEPDWRVLATPDTVVSIRNGVFYRLYEYDLSGIMQLESEKLTSLETESTAILVYRRFGEVTNTLIRVSPTVLKALDAFTSEKTIHDVAISLTVESPSLLIETEKNLIGLVNQLSLQQVLVEVKE